MKWTKEQNKAIEQRNSNILVAAAAGSGKTAVLVERIKQLILRDNVSLDELLVVTFTNAAAAEMREKIVKAIGKQISSGEGNLEFLRQQLNIAYKANISTFHSFALEIIRRYFYLIDLEPNLKICDEAQSKILKDEAIDGVLEEMFEEDSPEFTAFLDRYSKGKTLKDVKSLILKVHNTLQSIPYPYEWLQKNTQNLCSGREDFLKSKAANYMNSEIKELLRNIVADCNKVQDILLGADLIRLAAKQRGDIDYCQGLASAFETGGINVLATISEEDNSWVRLSPLKTEKDSYNLVKEEIKYYNTRVRDSLKKMKAAFFPYDFDTYIGEQQQTAQYALTLEKMVLNFNKKYSEAKREKRLLDFNDIEHFAIKILENEQVAQEYREKFKYIFIDEYQDSNIIQDYLIGKIKRSDNLFMVGDVKQSIYKFRLAEPELFMEKYRDYGEEATDAKTKIDLNKNYRSKRNIIDVVNRVFETMMEGYDENAALYEGVPYEGNLNYPVELCLVDGTEGVGITDSEGNTIEIDEEIAALKNAEMEAHIATELIKENIGTLIYDSKEGKERPLEKRDIVVLMRSAKKQSSVFRSVLEKNQIAAHTEDGSGYFDTIEIDVFLNLLRVIDNRKQDIPFISVLYSQILGFTVDELIKIRLAHKNGSFFEAFSSYCTEEGEVYDGVLQEKCLRAVESIDLWKTISVLMPLDEFIWKLMTDTGYYAYIGALPAGGQRQANLRALSDRAGQFVSNGGGGIYDFLSYIEIVKKKEIGIGQISMVSENDDVVRIMTIHKSKGLEYPMVIVAGLGKRFNFGMDNGDAAIHKDIGIGLTLANPEEHWRKQTIIQNIIEFKMRREEAQEELRILYVAMTRAKDRLFLIGTVKSDKMRACEEPEKLAEKILEKYDKDMCKDRLLNTKSYFDILIPIIYRAYKHSKKAKIRVFTRGNIAEARLAEGESIENIKKLIDTKNEVEEADAKLVAHRFSFEYPYKEETQLKSKYSVTELNKKAYEGEQKRSNKGSLRTPIFLSQKWDFTAAEKGTIYHTVMEHIDIGRAYQAENQGEFAKYWQGFAKDLTEKDILRQEEIKVIDVCKIGDFFKSDFAATMNKAWQEHTLYREVPFTLVKEREGTKILTQGIIDCWFSYQDGQGKGHNILLDYKTNYISGQGEQLAEILETYKLQLKIYKEALEKIKGIKVEKSYLYLFHLSRVVECD